MINLWSDQGTAVLESIVVFIVLPVFCGAKTRSSVPPFTWVGSWISCVYPNSSRASRKAEACASGKDGKLKSPITQLGVFGCCELDARSIVAARESGSVDGALYIRLMEQCLLVIVIASMDGVLVAWLRWKWRSVLVIASAPPPRLPLLWHVCIERLLGSS